MCVGGWGAGGGGVGQLTDSSVTFITASIEQIYGDFVCVCVCGGGCRENDQQ